MLTNHVIPRRHVTDIIGSDDARQYCVFSIFKKAAVRHLGFSYFRNFCEKFKFAPISSSSCVHPRLVFDGPNILVKLHVDRFNILRDIAIFIFRPFGLKLPIHAHFGEFWEGYDGVPLGIGYRRN